MRRILLGGVIAAWTAVMAGACLADATVPTADIAKVADNPLIKRYDGSFIVSFQRQAFAPLQIPLSALKPSPTPDERDTRNNRVHRAEKVEAVEGAVTRLVYVLPADRSPFEVLRNYQDEVKAAGGDVLFECKAEQCGGDTSKAASGGGGKMSLTQNFFYEHDVKDPAFSNGSCAVNSRINDQYYFAARLPQGAANAWVAVQTFQLNGNQYCKALNGRTIAIVHVVEPRQREQKMVLVKADDMSKAIERDGGIALYGIYFDTGEATLKPESTPTIEQIAALLKANPKLNLLVVGHTDNQGAYDFNVRLSERRANAVKSALVGNHGVAATRLTAAGAGMMAPVASNANEEGRARNRRVAIVRSN